MIMLLNADYVETDRDKDQVVCPFDKRVMQRIYCNSFSRGKGCRCYKECWGDVK